MNENNMNTQTNNNQVGGMNFVTGPKPVLEDSNTLSNGMQNNNVNPITQPIVNNTNAQSVQNPVSENVTEIPNSNVVVPQMVTNNVNNMVDSNVNNVQTNVVNQNPDLNTQQIAPVMTQSVIQETPNVVQNMTEQVQQPVSQSVSDVSSTLNVSNMTSNQTLETPVNQEPGMSSVLEEPKKKKRNPIITLLIIALLTVIGVAIGIFLFTKFGNNNNSSNNQNMDNNVEENTSTNLSNNIIKNTDVDNIKLNEVLSIVGIAPNVNVKNNNSLNYLISNNNYKDNAKDIIIYLAVNETGTTSSEIVYPDDYELKNDVGACSDSVSCALISKTDAEKLLKQLNLGTNLDDYFYKSSEIDDVYGIHFNGSLVMDIFDSVGTDIIHNLNAKMSNDTDIVINDIQIINTIDENGEIQTSNKNVTYIFKTSEDNSYYLDSVNVN